MRILPSVSATGKQQQQVLLPKPSLCTFVIESTKSTVRGLTENSAAAAGVTARDISCGSGTAGSSSPIKWSVSRLLLRRLREGLVASCTAGMLAKSCVPPPRRARPNLQR